MRHRRNFLRCSLGFVSYALVAELHSAGSQVRSLSARRWMSLQSDLARGLASGTIDEAIWHSSVNALAGEVDLEHLAAELRRSRIKDAGAPFGHDPQKRFVTALDEQGNPLKLGYGLALFDFDADSVITPHAHKHMVSAHMVLEGRVRIRAFNRVQDEDSVLIIRPTLDLVAEPGHAAAMTSPKDNVHWFASRSARAMTVDVIIDGLDPGKERYLIQPVDPLGGTTLENGLIRAPLISFERSMELYGAQR
jgi:hypothetical protein